MFDFGNEDNPKRKRSYTLPSRPNWLKTGCIGIIGILLVGGVLCTVITITVVNVVGSALSIPFIGGDGDEREDGDDD